MQAGYELEALRRVAEQLCAELGYGGTEPGLPGPWSPLPVAGNGGLELLSLEEHALVATVRRGLAKLAAAVGEERPRGSFSERSIGVALDGAELVMRGQLMGGRREELPTLMPSFVFLVTLPVVGQDEALQLAKRTSELIERALEY